MIDAFISPQAAKTYERQLVRLVGKDANRLPGDGVPGRQAGARNGEPNDAGARGQHRKAVRGASGEAGGGEARIVRSWDHLGRKFVEPKTKAGSRVVPLSGWLVAELSAHRARGKGTGLVFGTRKGTPMNPSNVRLRIWRPLKERAGVRALDLYSLRHTFASLGRTAGESAFNVGRMMGHAKSTLVDTVYAHSLQSGMASVAERVTARALGEQPKLRVIEGRSARDVREPLDETSKPEEKNVASR